MGYKKRSGTNITDFWPDDTDKEFFISTESYVSLAEVLDKAREKWSTDVDLEKLNIEAQHIHTYCLGYDRYDAGDYTDFLRITLRD